MAFGKGVTVTALAALATAALVGACSVAAFDGAGKQCPCVDGYSCDVASNLCVPAGSIVDASTPEPEAAATDGGDDAPAPRIVVSKLRATWSTANSVYFQWDVAGDPAEFRAYEITTGTSADAVQTRTGDQRVLRASDNPELGAFAGKDKTLNGDPVEPFTIADNLLAGSTFFAQVVALDGAGAVSRTPVVSVTTTSPAADKVIFTEADPAGTSSPATFARTTDRPYAGRYCYGYTVACPGGAPTCFVQLERAALALDVAAITAETFPNAFIQFAVAGGASVPSFYSDVMLFVGPPTCADTNNGAACRYRFNGWSFRGDGTYRLVQVPLRMLKRADGKALTFDELKAQGFKLHAFGISGTWATGASVRVDEVRVRY